MNRNNKELSKLLKIDELFSFYSKIGDSINNDIDLYSSGYDAVSRDNSIILLKKCGYINEEDESLSKTKIFDNTDSFSSELLKSLRIIYSNEIIDNILSLDKKYDETRGLFFIPSNKVDLHLSGLVMLLEDLGFLQILTNRIYILDETEAKKIASRTNEKGSKKLISIIELEHSLAIKKELGEIGEQKALEYELSLLEKLNISKTPKIISDVDVSAGYDLVSFLGTNSISYDKFIEVKSCQDKTCTFYLSQNELKTAKDKGSSYYLYLYIRETDEIIIINNPYEKIILSENWAKEPQIYKIHRTIDGDII